MSDPRLEIVVRELLANGAAPGQGMHSWRCEDKERYPDPCTCVEETAADILAALDGDGTGNDTGAAQGLNAEGFATRPPTSPDPLPGNPTVTKYEGRVMGTMTDHEVRQAVNQAINQAMHIPLIDPDCRDGKCQSCVGGPCEHHCHTDA